MDSMAQGPTPLHRYAGRQSPEGYGICEDCGARENTPEAARPCPIKKRPPRIRVQLRRSTEDDDD